MAENRQNREKSVSQRREEMEAFDEKFGYVKFRGEPTIAWLLNMVPTSILDEYNEEQACLEMYFLEKDTNNSFKGTYLYRPYFYIYVHEKYIMETTRYLEKTYSGHIEITVAQKVDLDQPNHLSGKLAKYLRLSFTCVRYLLEVRKEIMSYVKHNQSLHGKHLIYTIPESSITTFTEAIFDIREFDVPYYVRVCIDNDIRTGAWYKVIQTKSDNDGFINVEWQKDMVEKAKPKILAYDIECTKEPLKFPNSDHDSIYMISYMIDGMGYLIVDRKTVSQDIEDFEYTPKNEFPGKFMVFNEKDEEDLIKRFFTHIQEEKPNIVVTFNGDKFDMIFLEERAKKYNLNMTNEIGFYLEGDHYRGKNAVHMDAFCWVERDSYLPQGARGLKAVTRHKLGYDPVEISPENMLVYAITNPQYMATYSVSDAVATYYLYMQYVHLFVFSLCTIIPMNAEDVLRKGSGTLCEMLLQVEAYRGNIICPNKQISDPYTFHKGHWIETDTYIGGHVECLESGVFRSDLPVKFRLDPTAFQYLIDTIDSSLTFHIEVEEGLQRCDVLNYEEIKSQIIEKLEMLRDSPICNDKPILYHLDVAAMYPNIILTNRLQPSAIVNPQICSSCLFNRPENECKRKMKWEWRGEMYPLKLGEFKQIKRQLEEDSSTTNKKFLEMTETEQVAALKKRTKEYCRRVYGKLKVIETEVRDATICQRENSFYVNTVRSFRDRRYDYKKLTKKWNGVLKDIMNKGGDEEEIENAKTKVVLFDSLQLAHKCILNSFYGYVMRKGSRWMSMEMAGVVTHTGSNLITEARELVERIGRPLELDTDGIWCILPQSFPDVYTFKLKGDKKVKINYPSCMLNAETHTKYTNHQYQQLVNEKERKYAMRSECSIFFELDGPYRAMVLPASLEEGKLLKKRYAVFNFDGSLQELKGFELKRRGELQIIKIFQSQVFERFLLGDTLQECYNKVGETANYWLDVLYTHGKDMEDEELIDLISENRSMSRTLEDYGEQKSTSITTATRLSEILGKDMIKDKGLNCKFVVSKKPTEANISERAIPTVIFSMDEEIKEKTLKRWTKDNGLKSFDIRDIIDWDYYIERFGSCVQKIVTIPAAIQRAQNPVPRIIHPPWLKKLINDSLDTRKQIKIDSMFNQEKTVDIEDLFKQDRINNNINSQPEQLHVENVMEIEEEDEDEVVVDNEKENNNDNNSNKSIMMNEDLKQWYNLRKEEWKRMRSVRKRKRQEIFNNISSNTSINSIIKPTDNLQSYFNQQQRITALGYWQIIEICDLSSNGNLKLWAFTSRNTLQTITLHIEKTFYINTLDDNLPIGKKVKKILPHNHKLYNLYEIKMSDYDYHHPSKELLNILQSHNIRGIYEVNVPYLYKTLIQIGCITRVNKERRMKGNTSNSTLFNLEDLEYLTTSDYGYLMNETSSFIRLYLYCVENSNGNGIWMLFTLLPDNEKDINITVWEVSNQNNDMYNVRYKTLFNEIRLHNNISSYSSLRIKVNKVSSKNEFYKLFNKYIMDYQSSQKGPTIIITQTPYISEILRIDIPSLRDLPLVPLLYPTEDGKTYKSLTWKNEFAELSFNRFFKMNDLWEEKLGISRYTHIPVGNLTTDIVIEASDIFYGRLLTFNRHLLWANTSAFPDLGGYLMQNYIDSVFSGNGNNVTPFEQSNQGVYRSVCIELKIRNLIINTIRMSDHLSDMEDIETDDISQQFGFCDTAYNILRMLISRWISTAESTDLHLVDYFLSNCYRWLCSKSSLLYDPSIHSLICTLIKKILLLILSEFRHLGANIIFASFDKIIFCSNKFTLESAKSYLQYILDTISNHELFKYLVFEPQVYWDSLIWMDSYNYGGIVLENCVEEEEEEEEQREMEENNNEGQVNEIIEEENKGENDKKDKDNDNDDYKNQEVMEVEDGDDENENEKENDDQKETEDDEIMKIIEKHNRRKARNERIQQYHDSDGDEDEVDNDNGMEEEEDDYEDETLNGFIVDDEEIETSTGKIYRTEKGEANHTLKEKQTEQQTNGKDFSLHWLTATFLPAFLDAPFQVIIADFLLKPLNYRNNLIKDHPESTFDEINEKMTEYTKIYIKEEVFPTLSKLVKNIHDKVIEDDPETKTDRTFPKFSGSHLNLTSPTLEYIKVICKILGLEECIDLEVFRLKTNLLSLIKKRESSEECQYKNPCLSLIVPDVICSYCNECQNIDFCRDSSFLFPVNDDNNMWVCEHCGHPYNKLAIEYKLVELLDELISKYHYQDLRCVKCKNAKEDNISSACSCGGEYMNSEISSLQYIKLLTPFENIANYHQLSWLKEVINTYKH